MNDYEKRRRRIASLQEDVRVLRIELDEILKDHTKPAGEEIFSYHDGFVWIPTRIDGEGPIRESAEKYPNVIYFYALHSEIYPWDTK